jgi:putative Holliday junction resolvase
MRVLGLDVGTKTIGMALSDELGWTAQGLDTIRRNEANSNEDFKKLAEIVEQNNVDKIIVGLPKNMNGTIGDRGESCKQFAEELKKWVNDIPFEMWDERLSTVAAERMLISADVSRKKRKKVIDKIAAVVILQGYLDRISQ